MGYVERIYQIKYLLVIPSMWVLRPGLILMEKDDYSDVQKGASLRWSIKNDSICPFLGTTQWVLTIAVISPGNVFTLLSDRFC